MPRIEEILQVSMDARASDIHLTAGLPPKMRVNGHLLNMDFPVLKPEDTMEIVRQIMTDHQRAMFEERGELDMSFAVTNLGRYRVNVFRQRGSVAMAMRAVNTVIPSPAQLGVPNAVVDLYNRKRGLVLVTGPTGSGKSTTLASIIDKANNNRDAHIITLEDPIEYLHIHKVAMVNQREIGFDSMSYANALRAALREDPDIILVGEMRDYETISVAVTAAETGHLVLSTGIIHTAYHRCCIHYRPYHRRFPASPAAADSCTAGKRFGSSYFPAARSYRRRTWPCCCIRSYACKPRCS